MNSEFLPEADKEFREAVRYYENEAPGVGIRFVLEVRRGITHRKSLCRSGRWEWHKAESPESFPLQPVVRC